MVDSSSPEFGLGKKLGYLLMTYIGVRLIIKGTKIIIKSGRALLIIKLLPGATPL